MVLMFFTHPDFFESQSMPRFAAMLSNGMKDKGHEVKMITAKPFFYKFPVPKKLKKWMGYIDQYLIFPFIVRGKLKMNPKNILYVFTDHALGPWVPLVAKKPHVVHCHDFLAQLSAIGKFSENKTGWTGRQYQAFIRRGYQQSSNFISVSQKTKADLTYFLQRTPNLSEVVYNGLNQEFAKGNIPDLRLQLSKYFDIDLSEGYILHVGGNQWYKNRVGIIEIYNAWRDSSKMELPLLLIGQSPSEKLWKEWQQSEYKGSISMLANVPDEIVRTAYMSATLLLFPSIAEGFGWPIVEAMASGCPVITTNAVPMTEVAGEAAYLIAPRPITNSEIEQWAIDSAKTVERVVNLTDPERSALVERGILNAQRFDTQTALDNIENIYLKILDNFGKSK